MMEPMSFSIHLIPAFADNYIYVLGDQELGLALVVDPGDAEAVRKFLKKQDWHLALILNTHHHNDHTGGNLKLSQEYGAPIIAPAKERSQIQNISRGVIEGETVTFSDLKGHVIETPGHTKGGISYYFPTLKALFCGDTLFGCGCGRLFEGTPNEMWASLLKLRALPDDTLVYAAHEYTEKNIQFAMLLDQGNVPLLKRANDVTEKRKLGHPTMPSTMGLEKATNPFLRADDKAFQAALGKNGMPVSGTDPIAIFATLRAAKDRFASQGNG
jgi:hydroxyacylglutathione hydrolase